MKIIFLVKYYDGFIDSLNRKIKDNLSYQEIHDFVIDESSNIFAPYIKEFNKLGHKASIIIPNLDILQQKWCDENNILPTKNKLFNIPQEQIKKEKPDILFLSSNFEYYGSFLENLKPYVKKTCAWISCPFDDSLNLKNIDHIFTLFEPHFKKFKKDNKSVTLTHAAFDDNILKRLPVQKKYNFTFIGGVGNYHKKREKYLKGLIKKTPIKIWGYGYFSKHPIKNLIKQIKSGFIYNKVYQGEAWGVDMLKILSQSKITINVHGDIAEGHSVNMRMFEATGVGTLLLTEYTDNIKDFFEPGKEVICYRSIEEAIMKVNFYLNNNEERQKIALAGQKRTINSYTYKHLAKKYVSIFERLLKE